jgi:uncharacterized protein YgiB involved in biofilm formation
MTQRNHRDRTLRYLFIASGVLVVGGLGYLAYDLLNPPPTARYYATEQQCIADATLRKNGLTADQCRTQFRYAMQEYQRITPVYRTQPECQEDTGSICSPVSNPSGWRPDFGGAYLVNEYDDRDRVYVHSGSSYRVHPVLPVYRSASGLVTPSGSRIASPQSGVLFRSRDLSPSDAAPARPAGYAARGTVKGRGSFGSSVRLTAPRGFGGK